MLQTLFHVTLLFPHISSLLFPQPTPDRPRLNTHLRVHNGIQSQPAHLYEPPAFSQYIDLGKYERISNDPPKLSAMVFGRIREEASMLSSSLMRKCADNQIMKQTDLTSSLAAVLSGKMECSSLPHAELLQLFTQVISEHNLDAMACTDLLEIANKDPAVRSSFIQPFFFFKGFHATQIQRISHVLWEKGDFDDRCVALALQNRMSEVFSIDLHPGAVLREGLFMDHAHGIVIGETATLGRRCTILHGVTLGNKGGKTPGRRHPQIGDDVVLGAGASVLGNIYIANKVTIGARAVVTKSVMPKCTVVGTNKVLSQHEMEEFRGDLIDFEI